MKDNSAGAQNQYTYIKILQSQAFDAVVFTLDLDFLFKSISAYCELQPCVSKNNDAKVLPKLLVWQA